VTGVALGPDGLYFVPTLPDGEGRSGVFKIAHNPEEPHPVLLTHSVNPDALMEEKGCFGCHQLNGNGGTIGPSLDERPMVARLEARLNSDAYVQSLREVDRLQREPFHRFGEARAEVLRTPGREKVRTWMNYRLMEPKFDDPNARMPNMGLSKAEAVLITDYLLREKPLLDRWKEALLERVPAPLRPTDLLYRHLLLAFVVGLVAGASLFTLLPRVADRWRRSKHAGRTQQRAPPEGGHGEGR
jgi:hypothetical protein